jgi:RNA polymerase sigma factor (TIGR02999 family)
MAADSEDITRLLHEWRAGNTSAENELFRLVMPDLRRLARHMMRGERKGHSLQPTELVDQIYFRLVAARDRDWQNRRHFFAIAARAMRRYLIDHARGRPGAIFVGLDELDHLLPPEGPRRDLALTIDRLLDELAASQPEWSQVIEVKYFLGLTDEEAAGALGMKLRTLQRTWRDARRWLYQRIESGHARTVTQ